MARYTADHKDETRERILRAAAKEFRSHGYASATVPGIMETAGLTVGGFYKHFESKAALFAEMFGETLKRSTERSDALKELAGKSDWLGVLAENYLSPVHRDNVRGGCVMAALASDMPRADHDAKIAYETELERYIDVIAEAFDGDREKALAYQAMLIGGLIMARGIESADLADEILDACRHAATDSISR